MIAIIDYGVGNLFSLSSSLGFLGLETKITRKKEDIEQADRIILPGVGAFADAVEKLRGTGLVDTIRRQAGEGKPLLGICLGMQLLFDRSYEYGERQGLGLIPGAVCPIEPDLKEAGAAGLKVPHIGWNSLRFTEKGRAHPLLKNNGDGDYVYYVHSFYAKDCVDSTLAVSEYGVEIPGAVARGSVMGVQFHPEKSGKAGLAMLKAFARMEAGG